ncbi:uncharacterized protein B0H18DRAFT_1021072 [Fomitopsis serialis]|uniref:uncharacterized protein n=1 Tax=Fomitopsis serialis TaxID=139415 RepID=UPI0020088BE6|nr:uncharacterized protein B0H18DRAFT_1021072 [Neoantrodia serialis]KAH9921437.1 hypothetical protein B0H18DRAFT_1021072 [Neoantrodia serialis]
MVSTRRHSAVALILDPIYQLCPAEVEHAIIRRSPPHICHSTQCCVLSSLIGARGPLRPTPSLTHSFPPISMSRPSPPAPLSK